MQARCWVAKTGAPMANDVLVIDETVSIPYSELTFRYSRSSGPGGQHVQRSESRVELLWDVANSPSLTEEQRRRTLERLGNRLDQEGGLHLTSQATRSQHENKQEVTKRLQRLLAAALRPRARRKRTKPSAAARRRRLEAKRRRSTLKRLRGPVSPDE